MTKINIKELRKLGGDWKAEQLGFGYYRYVGKYKEHTIELQNYAHSSMSETGDSDYYSQTHVSLNGKNVYIGYSLGAMFYLDNQLIPGLETNNESLKQTFERAADQMKQPTKAEGSTIFNAKTNKMEYHKVVVDKKNKETP